MNKIEVTKDVFDRFNKLRGFDTHIKFVDKLLDLYEESLKPKEEVVEAPKEIKPKTTRKRKTTTKENSNAN